MRLHAKRNPILPDSQEGLEGAAMPHPDGRAWVKACPECAGRTNDPQGMGDKYQRDIMRGDAETVFYCIHREDRGKHRICACYAALHPELR